MAGKRADTILEVMHRVEQFTLGRAWQHLTDDALFWEPVHGAWGIRRRQECTTPDPFGAGEWVADFDLDRSVTGAPMTTIGWLFWHVGSAPGRLTEIEFLGGDHEMSSGWTSPYLTHHPVFTRAADAVGTMRTGWEALKATLGATDDAVLEAPVAGYTYAAAPARDGLCALGPPGPATPAIGFVAGAVNEISHHATQICALRDLYETHHP